jgi:hypothetical protein
LDGEGGKFKRVQVHVQVQVQGGRCRAYALGCASPYAFFSRSTVTWV